MSVYPKLDAHRWQGPPAPEGSPERIEARRRLCLMAQRAFRVREQDPKDWITSIYLYAPQLAGAVGPDEVDRIAKVIWSMCHKR